MKLRTTPPLLPLAPISRRSLLQAGAASALAAMLAPLPRLLAQQAVAQDAIATPRAKNLILLYLSGGPSHLDTFDLKPGTKYAGAFSPIETAVDGIRICEHLPRLAQQMQHLAIVRSITSNEADHGRGMYLVHTGHVPTETVRHPSVACVAASELAQKRGPLPVAVSIGGLYADAGCLGVEYEPLVVGDPGSARVAFVPPQGVSNKRMSGRLQLLDEMNAEFAQRSDARVVGSGQRLWKQASAMLTDAAVNAFDLEQEPVETRKKYGEHSFGQGCLLARRLMQRGVRFAEVILEGWDTHSDNFNSTEALMGALDPAFASLVEELAADGLLAQTLVCCIGEFGRTPEINKDSGRDHHSLAYSAVVGGGGLRVGQVVGATNESGHEVKERPVTVPDLLATLYRQLGLDPRDKYFTPEGRPIRRLDVGEPVRELTG